MGLDESKALEEWKQVEKDCDIDRLALFSVIFNTEIDFLCVCICVIFLFDQGNHDCRK